MQKLAVIWHVTLWVHLEDLSEWQDQLLRLCASRRLHSHLVTVDAPNVSLAEYLMDLRMRILDPDLLPDLELGRHGGSRQSQRRPLTAFELRSPKFGPKRFCVLKVQEYLYLCIVTANPCTRRSLHTPLRNCRGFKVFWEVGQVVVVAVRRVETLHALESRRLGQRGHTLESE